MGGVLAYTNCCRFQRHRGGGIYKISHHPTFCCEALCRTSDKEMRLAFATKSWPRFSWVGVWPGDFWCSPALPATKANRRDGCCTRQSLKQRWKHVRAMPTSLEQRLYRSKGGSSLHIEKAVCTALLLARNLPRAIAGKVLYQAGALDLLTKAVMNVSVM